MDSMRVWVSSHPPINNEYLLLLIDVASRFPLAFPLPSKKDGDIDASAYKIVPDVWSIESYPR